MLTKHFYVCFVFLWLIIQTTTTYAEVVQVGKVSVNRPSGWVVESKVNENQGHEEGLILMRPIPREDEDIYSPPTLMIFFSVFNGNMDDKKKKLSKKNSYDNFAEKIKSIAQLDGGNIEIEIQQRPYRDIGTERYINIGPTILKSEGQEIFHLFRLLQLHSAIIEINLTWGEDIASGQAIMDNIVNSIELNVPEQIDFNQ